MFRRYNEGRSPFRKTILFLFSAEVSGLKGELKLAKNVTVKAENNNKKNQEKKKKKEEKKIKNKRFKRDKEKQRVDEA